MSSLTKKADSKYPNLNCQECGKPSGEKSFCSDLCWKIWFEDNYP